MEGGPSQMDLFDPKPELQKWSGKSLPESMTKDLKLAFIKPTAAVLASPRDVQAVRPVRHGTFPTSFRTSPPAPTTSAWFDRCTPRRLIIIPGQLSVDDRIDAVRPSDDGRVGHSTVSAASRRTCRALSVLSSGVGTSGGASNFSSGFLPSTYQAACCSAVGRSDSLPQQSARVTSADVSAPTSMHSAT